MCSVVHRCFVDYGNNGDVWRLTRFYGHPETSRREETWTLLESLSQVSDVSWQCIGDFNEITKASENKRDNVRPMRQMNRFRSVINLCVFHDLGFHGVAFPWFKNNSDESRLKIRSDQALGTNAWRQKFKEATLHHIPTLASDQSMLSLQLVGIDQQTVKNKFWFKAML